MKKIQMQHKEVIDKMLDVDKHAFLDLIADNFRVTELQQHFGKYLVNTKLTSDLFYDAVIHLTQIILSKSKDAHDILIKIASINNKYIRRTNYLDMSEEELLQEIRKDYIVSEHNKGITPVMLLFYFYSQNIFQHEKIDMIKRLYNDYLSRIEVQKNDTTIEEAQNLRKHFKSEEAYVDNTLKYLVFYLNDEYTFQGEKDEENFKEKIKDAFKAEVIDEEHFKVKNGLLYFFYNYYIDIVKGKESIDNIEKVFIRHIRQLSLYREAIINFLSEKHKILEENNKLKSQNQKYKKELRNIEKKISGYSKSDNQELIKENQNLLKENYRLKLEMERMQEYIDILEEEEKINETLDENIEIKEKTVSIDTKRAQANEYFQEKFRLKDIVVVGGFWNSQQKKKLASFVDEVNGTVSFIRAEETLRRIERIKNADLIIFDTSYNSHHYYYKVKKVAKDMLHITNCNQLLFTS